MLQTTLQHSGEIFLAKLWGILNYLIFSYRVNLEQNRSQINTNIERNWTDFFTSYNCLYIYTALTLAMIGTGLLRSLSFYGLCLKASKNLHSTVFSKIILSSMYFFNTNPSGRILNRFSKDMGIIDEALPISLADALQVRMFEIKIIIFLELSVRKFF